jgi:hypothetical protein
MKIFTIYWGEGEEKRILLHILYYLNYCLLHMISLIILHSHIILADDFQKNKIIIHYHAYSVLTDEIIPCC